MSRLARVILALVRPSIMLVLLMFAALGMAAGGQGNDLVSLLTKVLPLLACWFVNATALNDLADEPIDRINLPIVTERPLLAGLATRRELEMIAAVAGLAAPAAGLLVDGPRVALAMAVGVVLNYGYSMPPLRLSGRGLTTILLLPVGYVALPYSVGLWAVGGSFQTHALVLLAGLFLTFMGRIVLKDFRDVEGDLAFGKRTFLVRHGKRSSLLLSGAASIAGCGALIALESTTVALASAVVVLLACLLSGLVFLARVSEAWEEQAIISAIAGLGRGMGLVLLAHLTMRAGSGVAVLPEEFVLILLTATFVGSFMAIIARRRSALVVGMRPL